MKFLETDIKGLYEISPNVFEDNRGYFSETFSLSSFKDIFGEVEFIQDNESKSCFGVLRGLHIQKKPFEQSKLIRVIEGEVLDVVVDLRENSQTYGKTFSIILNDINKKQLFIPRGFAHGFVVLSESVIFSYKVDNYYSPENETGIIWNDEDLNIDWKIDLSKLILSEKDIKLNTFKEFKKNHG